MPSLPVTPRSGLEQVLATNRQRGSGVMLALRSGRALAAVSARKNQLDALVGRVRDIFGLELTHIRKCAIAGPIALVWAGAGQWLAMGDGEDGPAFEQRLRAALDGLASVSDQSDARTIIRVSGERARDVLAKGVPIDLHPDAFRAGDAAVTTVAHMGAHFWQVDGTPTYEFIVSRSFAVALWEWVVHSAAEFGEPTVNQGNCSS
jgi:heterotetrameric sarcosine oxidase gamma subunit